MADSARVSVPKTQASHRFRHGTVVRFDGTNWVRGGGAGAGLVSGILDANTFEFASSGELDGLDGLTPGALYYAGTDGELTTTVSGNPIFQAHSASAGAILPPGTTAAGTVVGDVTEARLAQALGTERATSDATYAPLAHSHDTRYTRLDDQAVWSEVDGTPVVVLTATGVEQVVTG